jgi:phenylacetate-CoA ligase
MMLTQGLRHKLETRFSCPVLDIYSMNEVGPIAVFDPVLDGHVLLQPSLHVEILDEGLRPVADGERGEITVTGGFNFCLPLLRYRTGDYGALSKVNGQTMITGLQGREPVRFRTAAGVWINNVDVSHALKTLPAAQFGLHQNADGTLILRLAARSMQHKDEAACAINMLLGDLPLQIETIMADDKFLQYTTDADARA